MKKRNIALLGSTGSIGTQALDVIRRHPQQFEARILTAGNNADLLIRQAREFHPDTVVIANETLYDTVSDALADLPIKVYAGSEALCQVVESDAVDMVLTAMVGFAGLQPTLHALKAHKAIALANKETLVVAGELVTRCALDHHAAILPGDSEHSAIFQCLAGEGNNAVERLLLTASGGPFRTYTADALATVTCAQALRHPNWAMGAKITIDSATMMNKGFEMIEAKWLFGVAPSDIEILVHPESVVHSAVQFRDGAVKAQLGCPDMRLPIQYAFSYPQRLSLDGPRLDLFALQGLHFERPDLERFPCLQLAYDATARGGNMPCILNAANEVANWAFRQGTIAFTAVADVIQATMQRATFEARPDLDVYLATDAEARRLATEALRHHAIA
jgi:1-deoxy-D-xylulose-5-phosphate reductoisomerase